MPEHFHENNNYHHHVTNTLNISQNYTYFFNVHALKQTQVSVPSSAEKNMEKVEKNRKKSAVKHSMALRFPSPRLETEVLNFLNKVKETIRVYQRTFVYS